jgi:hypothetical protein
MVFTHMFVVRRRAPARLTPDRYHLVSMENYNPIRLGIEIELTQ